MNSAEPVKILAISGSLRGTDSLNTALLRAVSSLAPKNLEVTVRTLQGVPLYSEELEAPNVPPAVTELRHAVADADGLIYSTPEYNRGMSGAMKNALDWLSRPVFEGAGAGKDCIALVATESVYHGMDAWVDLARTLRHMNNHVVEPDLVIHTAHKDLAVDEDGTVHILNAHSEQAIRLQLSALEASIQAGMGRQILAATDKFYDALIRPSRQTRGQYPLKLRQLRNGVAS